MKKIIIPLLLCLIPSIAFGLTYTVKKATDQGDPNTYGSAAFMVGVAGSKVAILRFPHNSNSTNTNYTFATSVTFPDTLILDIEPGALLSVPVGNPHIVIRKLLNSELRSIFNDPNGMITYNDEQTLTWNANVTINCNSGATAYMILSGATSAITLSNGINGKVYRLRLTQDSTGSRLVTWVTTIKWRGGSAPTLTTTINKSDWITFVRSNGEWYADACTNF